MIQTIYTLGKIRINFIGNDWFARRFIESTDSLTVLSYPDTGLGELVTVVDVEDVEYNIHFHVRGTSKAVVLQSSLFDPNEHSEEYIEECFSKALRSLLAVIVGG